MKNIKTESNLVTMYEVNDSLFCSVYLNACMRDVQFHMNICKMSIELNDYIECLCCKRNCEADSSLTTK